MTTASDPQMACPACKAVVLHFTAMAVVPGGIRVKCPQCQATHVRDRAGAVVEDVEQAPPPSYHHRRRAWPPR